MSAPRNLLQTQATSRKTRKANIPMDNSGNEQKVVDYFGVNVFDVFTHKSIPKDLREKLEKRKNDGTTLTREDANIIAKAACEWAVERGATHFCHWFQPLTGSTAEKHDAFLDFEDNAPIQKLSGSQLMQGEPDASSFPNGGSRSTFEARGYTSWDMTSPLFVREGENGKTLCIPTAFVSYTGEALDIKTPLLRSVSRLNKVTTEFLNLTGLEDVKRVHVTCGAEQEYFLVDKTFFYRRPDLVMSGRTLLGSLTSRNQQLDDHYFGAIPGRVLGFMQELEVELYKLGIPAKTRHNEVAPGQFELASIFRDANVAADQNQMIMAMIKDVANKHDFVAVLHEKPFADINGSGKHLNWSMADNMGRNVLEPGDHPEENKRFLTFVSMIVEAIHRRSKIIRTAIGSHSNDHRLGANEAPPSIMSVFLGDTIQKVFDSLLSNSDYTSSKESLDTGVNQLVNLAKDNTDRNRTSPFAFTGNKFEFRAVGSSAAIGYPLAILNAAVSEVIQESNEMIKKSLGAGKSIDESLTEVTVHWLKNSGKVIFNGDGYSDDWLKEAEKRGLPNLKTTADALTVFNDKTAINFLMEQGIFKESELEMRHNVLLERYIMQREIEFKTLKGLVDQHVLPAAISYKKTLAESIDDLKDVGVSNEVEKQILKNLSHEVQVLFDSVNQLQNGLVEFSKLDESEFSLKIAHDLMPLCEKVSNACGSVESIVPDKLWDLPKTLDMLFLR